MAVSCSNDDDNNTINSSNFYGLGIGNTWTYQFNDLQGTWNENMQTVTITGMQSFGGEDYFVKESETTFDDGSPNDIRIEYLREDAQGYLVNSEGFILAHPTDTNFIGISPAPGLGANSEYHTFLDQTNVTTVVPAGTFSNSFTIGLILYDNQNQTQVGNGMSEFVYDKEIGLIKVNQSFTNAAVFVYEKVLISYFIN